MNDKEMEVHVALNHHNWVTPQKQEEGKWTIMDIDMAWKICTVCGAFKYNPGFERLEQDKVKLERDTDGGKAAFKYFKEHGLPKQEHSTLFDNL